MSAIETAAIILARGGSKGIPRKNLMPINGLSLLARSIKAAHSAQGSTHVWVSTDDDEIAAEAHAFGAFVIDRPEDLSADTASSEAGWLHALEVIRALGHDPRRLVFLQCTSPFTSGRDIDACLEKLATTAAKSVLSVVPDHGFLWSEDDAGLAFGTNHDHLMPRKRRQDLPPSYRENGAIYVIKTEAFEETQTRFAPPVAVCEVDHPPLEIDSQSDLDLARNLARQKDQAILPDLSAIRALVMDFDGVHTDDLVHTTETGAEVVVTSRSDGMGLGKLRDAGQHELLILSKERNPVVLSRAKKLKIDALNAVDNKLEALDQWCAKKGLNWQEVVFVGNDINDLEVLGAAGFAACPNDARPEVKAICDWIIPAPGGRGALRLLCDALMDAAQ